MSSANSIEIPQLNPTSTIPSEGLDAPSDSVNGKGNENVVSPSCQYCGRIFGTMRGLNQHTRCCKGKPLGQPENAMEPATSSIITSISSSQSGIDSPSESSRIVESIDETVNVSGIWGCHDYPCLYSLANEMYDNVVFWRKNLFKLPSGSAGKDYIRECTRLINLWNGNVLPMADVALKLLMVMPALLLQKPSRKSNAKQHTEYLRKRLELWNSGNFRDLITEGKTIQKQLDQQKPKSKTPEQVAKTFAKLMLEGKVNAALRLLDTQESVGVAPLTEEVVSKLKDLHPEAKPSSTETLMEGEVPWFDPVVFTDIDEESIAKAAMKTKGAAGPSGLDAEGWRRILISKNYGSAGKDLRKAIAKMTQMLCMREVELVNPNTTNIEAYVACRLIPLEKKPSGIRPIGIGEVLRRIIGKAVIAEIKPDLAQSAGCLQLCAGQQLGCEAAAHAMSEIFQEEETDAVLLIDASNAFNSLNRDAMLHNIRYLCPPLSMYVNNCYKVPSRLLVMGGVEISSADGTTQGDPSAMPSYAIGILPFLALIKPENEPEKMKHVAYADDLGGGSKLEKIRSWWQKTVDFGPAIGYYPKPEKSWLIVKPHQLTDAEKMFEGTGVNITTVGHKYLGGYVGSGEGTTEYKDSLVKEWLAQLDVLVSIAKIEPQAAYSAFVSGFKHKMTYFIRTIPNMALSLKPLDAKIDQELIPAITEGHHCSRVERLLLSLPVKMGGLGLPIFSESCELEFKNSKRATSQLTEKIMNQIHEYNLNRAKQKEIELVIEKERKERHEKVLKYVRNTMQKDELRANDLAQLKGASAWLNALPLKEEGYSLSKREFYDALQLRYRWGLNRLPTNCVCSKRFDVDHAMQCTNGGFIHKRHDKIRNTIAKLLDEVCHDVRIEPPLQPLSGEVLPPTANTDDEARLDVSARDFWFDGGLAFFDVRVFNPFAKTHLNTKLETVFNQNERQKKSHYNQRVITVEHGSFSPIVLSAYGGFGKETDRFITKLTNKLSEKKEIPNSVMANYIRTKLSFELVRSQVLCVRGSRKLWSSKIDVREAEVVDCAGVIRDR